MPPSWLEDGAVEGGVQANPTPAQVVVKVDNKDGARPVEALARADRRRCPCGPSDALKLLVIVAAVAAAAWLLNSQGEKLVVLTRFIQDLGFGGRCIFFVLFLWVGTPLGYNWSTLVVLVGFSYGWVAVLDANIGTASSAIVNFYAARFCFKRWLERRVEGFGDKRRMYLLAMRAALETGRMGFLLQVFLRVQPVQTFGLTNAFVGAFCAPHPFLFLTSTMVGMQLGILMMVSVGNLVREVGSLQAATGSTRGQLALAVQAGVLAAMLLGSLLFRKIISSRVLPGLLESAKEQASVLPPCDQGQAVCENAEAPLSVTPTSPPLPGTVHCDAEGETSSNCP